MNYIIFVGSLIFFQTNVVSTFFREHPDGGVGKIAGSVILGRLFESAGQLRSVYSLFVTLVKADWLSSVCVLWLDRCAS